MKNEPYDNMIQENHMEIPMTLPGDGGLSEEEIQFDDTKEPMSSIETYTLSRTGQRHIRFTGRRIAGSSGKTGVRKNVYVEITVYDSQPDTFFLQIFWKDVIHGDKQTVQLHANISSVVDAMETFDFLAFAELTEDDDVKGYLAHYDYHMREVCSQVGVVEDLTTP